MHQQILQLPTDTEPRNREMKTCGESMKIKFNSDKQNKVVFKKKKTPPITTKQPSAQLKRNTSDNPKALSSSL